MAKLFRKNAIDHISSPEQLDDYIKVSNPRAWMILAVILLCLIGLFIWSIFCFIEDQGVIYRPIQLLFNPGT